MSHVTNVLLSFSVMEDYNEGPDGDDLYTLMGLINAWLIHDGYGAFGREVDHVTGGHKPMEVPVFAAGFNHFDLDGFLAMLRTLPWVEPEVVQVFVYDQDDDRFRVIEPLGRDRVVVASKELS